MTGKVHHHKVFAFLAGFLLSLGISVSGMIDPNKILAFLDVAGNWDPTLLVVLGGAVGVTLITFRFVLRMPRPLLHHQFVLPTLTKADRPLIVGQLLFGIGWGLIGYCPGPVFSSLALGYAEPVIVMLAMVAGALLYKQIHVKS
ncbi:MAG: YeeE/YedE family protein [Thiobacillaceae bacterium]|jgi:hypothetical protein|nr:YeeE/YedE family protein [Thiobacillaceae bacterium]